MSREVKIVIDASKPLKMAVREAASQPASAAAFSETLLRELQLHLAELEMQNGELRRTQVEIEAP
jgi:hypothetical protein